MKSKLFIASAALTTCCVIYLVRLFNQAEATENVVSAERPVVQSDVESIPKIEIPPEKIVGDNLEVPTTEIVINADEASSCYGPQGTRLDFPAGCFADANGKIVSGKILLRLQECYDVPDMLKAELSTTSDGRILETAGMINLVASQNGNSLKVVEGKSYAISFPRNGNEKEDFKLFYGVRNPDGIMNWELASLAEDNNMPEREETSLTEAANVPYTPILADGESCFIQISESYLRRNTKVSEMDYFNWRTTGGQMLNQWFVSNFNPDLEMLDDFCVMNLRCEVTFKVNRDGSFNSYYITESSGDDYDNKIVSFLKTMPALDLQQLMPAYTDDHSCILTFSSFKGDSQDEIAKGFRQKFTQQPDSAMKNVDASLLDYYVLNSSQLGWINCDRFYDEEDKMVDYFVESNGSEKCTVSMVFDDINSIVRGSSEDGLIVFRDIPANRKVRIIGLDNRDGRVLMAVAKSNTNDKSKTLTTFKPVSINELDMQFAKLN